MRRRRAFTLLEGMFTMLIVFLVMGVASTLLVSYTSILNNSANKSSTLTSLQVALQQMLDDVRQSTQLVSPPAGGSATDLRFQKVDPNAAWLPTPIPANPPPWTPLAPANLVEVHYVLTGDQLTREIGPVGSAPTNLWQVSDGVAGLQVSDLGKGIQIVMTLRETHRTLVITGVSGNPSF